MENLKLCKDVIILFVLFWVYLPRVIAGIVIDILEHEGPPWVRQRIAKRFGYPAISTNPDQ